MKHIKIVSLISIFIFALSCLLFLPKGKADVIKSKYFNYVEKGAKVVKTSPSTQYKLMETYPQATVTVYNVGTTDLASLWSDRDGLIIKANPFTANVDSFYEFYVDCGKYDIKFSGTGIASPYTYGDVFICGAFSESALTFDVGADGTDFNVAIVGSTVTYNLPSASLLNRGAVTITDQSFNGNKTFDDNVIIDSGNLQFTGTTSGRITIQPAAIAGTYTLTLPTDDGTANQVLQTDGSGILSWATVGGGGSGTVTNFSAGNLSPLFTTSVADATTTPALTFSLSNAATNTYFGNNTGSPASPAFIAFAATSPIVITQGVGTTTFSCPTCSTGSGFINPTDTFIPYRANATTFLDSPLSRLSANEVEQRNGTNGQQFYIHKTWSGSGANFERLAIGWDAGANTYHIKSEAGGTGVAGTRDLQIEGFDDIVFVTSLTGSTGFFIENNGDIYTLTDNSFSIGQLNSNRFKNISIGGYIKIGDAGAKPTCDSSTRGTFFHDFGGAGVADTVEVCSKDAADVYAWRSLY